MEELAELRGRVLALETLVAALLQDISVRESRDSRQMDMELAERVRFHFGLFTLNSSEPLEKDAFRVAAEICDKAGVRLAGTGAR